MKKLFAFFLVLALLLPMGVVAQAEEVETKPFYLIQWSAFESELTNVYQMPFMWVNRAFLDDPLGCTAYGGDYDIAVIAQKLKEEFADYPEGARQINFDLGLAAFRGLAEDVVFVDKAIPVVQEWLHAFCKEFKSIGGELDGLVVDIEFEDLYATYIHSRYYTKDNKIYSKIEENPLYEKEIRPLLVERGFKFYENISEYTPELYAIHPSAGDEYAQSRSIWDAVLRSYINGKLTEACSVVWEYYPDCEVNDYQSCNIDAWQKTLSDFGGWTGSGGNYFTVGNSSNENYYSVRPYNFFTKPATQEPAYNTLPGYNSAVYENKTFNYFMFDMNIFKTIYLAADDGAVSWWIAHYLYNKGNKNSASLTPYYAETLLHMGMLNPVAFYGYIIPQEIEYEGDYEFSLQLVDDCLKELTRMVGAADRKPISVTPTWNDHFILSGMNAGGKNVWRLTPDTSLVSKEDFLVDGKTDPTFYVNGQTVTFPGGKIVADGKISGYENYDAETLEADIVEDASYGYWIETAANVEPVITRSENYHSEYPAFGEDYEGYKAGMEYNFKNALPTACWEVRKTGNASATVVANPADANDQVLALKGNYTIRNVNLPANITAGDSYAEHQAWEVSVTLPSDMAADAELVLLNATSEKKKSNDGGFKIAGNKVYYSQNGEYVELEDVTLAAGTEYRLVREVDFTNAKALTSDFYVYDASGNLVGSAKKIAMAEVTLPVASINLMSTNVNGEAVLLDDYKLYPTKVGVDFELYGARLGMQITEMDKPQAEDVAYRLSWMNANNVEKTYSVVAAYYNGETLASEEVIKEIKMAPNMEGIETGIVELGSKGQSVRVYLRDDNPAEDEPNAGGNGGSDKEPVNGADIDMTTVIIIAAAAVVVIAVVVVVVVVSSKKKAKKAEKTPETEEIPATEEAPAAEEVTETEETPETDAE